MPIFLRYFIYNCYWHLHGFLLKLIFDGNSYCGAD